MIPSKLLSPLFAFSLLFTSLPVEAALTSPQPTLGLREIQPETEPSELSPSSDEEPADPTAEFLGGSLILASHAGETHPLFLGVEEGGTVSGIVEIRPNQEELPGIRKAAYYLNGTQSGKVYQAPFIWGGPSGDGTTGFNTETIADGDYELRMVYTDTTGDHAVFIHFTVNNTSTPPPPAEDPREISRLDLSSQTSGLFDIAQSGSTVFLADAGRVFIVDASNASEPQVLNTLDLSGTVIDITADGNNLFAVLEAGTPGTPEEGDRLVKIDITDPQNPVTTVLANFIDRPRVVFMSEGQVVVGHNESSEYPFIACDPAGGCDRVDQFFLGGIHFHRFIAPGQTAFWYVTNNIHGEASLFQTSGPNVPDDLVNTEAPGTILDFAGMGRYVYALLQDEGTGRFFLALYDAADLTVEDGMKLLGMKELTLDFPFELEVMNNRIAIVGDTGIELYDITDPSNPLTVEDPYQLTGGNDAAVGADILFGMTLNELSLLDRSGEQIDPTPFPTIPEEPEGDPRVLGVTEGETVSGVVEIRPNPDEIPGVRKVAYYLNGSQSGKVYQSPFIWGGPSGNGTTGFDTTTIADGDYTLRMVYTDAAGDHPILINFTVDNTTPPPPDVEPTPIPASGRTLGGLAFPPATTSFVDINQAGNLSLLGDDNALHIVDASDPSSPQLLSTLNFEAEVYDILAVPAANAVFVLERQPLDDPDPFGRPRERRVLWRIDVSNPAQPVQELKAEDISVLFDEPNVARLFLSDNGQTLTFVYFEEGENIEVACPVTGGECGQTFYNIFAFRDLIHEYQNFIMSAVAGTSTIGLTPTFNDFSETETPAPIAWFSGKENFLFVSLENSTVAVYDVNQADTSETGNGQIPVVETVPTEGDDALFNLIFGNRLAVLDSTGLIEIFDITDPLNVTRVDSVTVAGARRLDYDGENLYVVTGNEYRIVSRMEEEPGDGPFEETAGQVVIEGESFSTVTEVNGQTWQIINSPEDSAGQAIQALPELGRRVDDITQVPRVDYPVFFNNPGTYYIWVRGFAQDGDSDSLHVGLNGALVEGGNRVSGFTFGGSASSWTNQNMDLQRVQVDIPQPGEYNLNLWMREDSFIADKILLTQDENFTPAGLGPEESPRKLSDPPSDGIVVEGGTVEENGNEVRITGENVIIRVNDSDALAGRDVVIEAGTAQILPGNPSVEFRFGSLQANVSGELTVNVDLRASENYQGTPLGIEILSPLVNLGASINKDRRGQPGLHQVVIRGDVLLEETGDVSPIEINATSTLLIDGSIDGNQALALSLVTTQNGLITGDVGSVTPLASFEFSAWDSGSFEIQNITTYGSQTYLTDSGTSFLNGDLISLETGSITLLGRYVANQNINIELQSTDRAPDQIHFGDIGQPGAGLTSDFDVTLRATGGSIIMDATESAPTSIDVRSLLVQSDYMEVIEINTVEDLEIASRVIQLNFDEFFFTDSHLGETGFFSANGNILLDDVEELRLASSQSAPLAEKAVGLVEALNGQVVTRAQFTFDPSLDIYPEAEWVVRDAGGETVIPRESDPEGDPRVLGVTEGETVSGVVEIRPNPDELPGIRKAAYYLNGTQSGKVYQSPFIWGGPSGDGTTGFDTAAIADGNYELRMVYTDAAGDHAILIHFTVDN